MNTGEFASFCGVDKKTLFHYDAIGLLKPAAVRENGYREYTPEQIYDMDMIKIFQASGYRLSEIRQMLEADQARRPELMRQARQRLEGQIERLCQMRDYLRGKEAFLEELAAMPPEGYRIDTLSFSYGLKEVDASGDHFFSFLRDGLYSCFVLEAGGGIRLCRLSPAGERQARGTAIRFFFKTASYDRDLEAHIREKLDAFGFPGEYPWFVENLPHFLLEDPESALLKITVFREKEEKIPLDK